MFYDTLQKALVKHGLDMTPFVRSLGMSPSNVTQWKAGKEPRNSTKKKIADALGVEVSVFIDNEYSEKEKSPTPDSAEGEEMYYYKKLLKADKATQDYIKSVLDREVPD